MCPVLPSAQVGARNGAKREARRALLLRFSAALLLLGSAVTGHGQSALGPTPIPTIAPCPTPFEGIGSLMCEGFDTVAPPDLPSGWQTSFASGAADCTPTGTCQLGTTWITTPTDPYSGPYCAFHDAPACVTDSVLDSRSIFVPTLNYTSISISFRHKFNLENGRDGGVLEISIDGGPFTDIGLDYNGTISTGFQSPIAGRPAWTGDSGGYITGSGGMPSAAIGHSIVLRFRLATDCSGAGTGWSIDQVLVTYTTVYPPRVIISGRVGNCAAPAPTATPPATPTPPTLPPVPDVLMMLSGSSSGDASTDSSGNYSLSVTTIGQFPGTYTVTPSKGSLAPGSAAINTVDALAIQRHFLTVAVIPAGCRLTAADANIDGSINTQDVLAVQRFFLGLTTGIGSVGQHKFVPANRTYTIDRFSPNQPGQDYSMYVVGDVAATFANRSTEALPDAAAE